MVVVRHQVTRCELDEDTEMSETAQGRSERLGQWLCPVPLLVKRVELNAGDVLLVCSREAVKKELQIPWLGECKGICVEDDLQGLPVDLLADAEDSQINDGSN